MCEEFVTISIEVVGTRLYFCGTCCVYINNIILLRTLLFLGKQFVKKFKIPQVVLNFFWF